MAMYNSAATSNQEDGDATIISHSLFYNPPKAPRHVIPVVNGAERQKYLLDDADASEAVQEIEQVLENYRKELRQESNTQLDCNRKLITRLFDFIRPTYTTHKKKMNDLNALFTEISQLQDSRFLQTKDKHDQLTSEILHLKKLIITTANEGHCSKNTARKVYRIHSMVNYEQWMAMEEDTRKLHTLVELQRDRINELINLLSQEDTSSIQSSSSRNLFAHFGEIPARKRQSATSSTSTERLLVATIKSLGDEQHDSGTDTLQRSINEFHSIDTLNNEERPSVIISTLSPFSRISSYNDIKKCPICNNEFHSIATDTEIARHVETCLSSTSMGDVGELVESKPYICPYCSRQYQSNDEKAYHQHLALCYTEYPDTL